MNKRIAAFTLLLSLAYVGLGTIGLIFINSSSDIIPLILLITLPVSFISFGVLYTEGYNIYLLLSIQTIVLFAFWALLFHCFKRK